MKGGFLKKARPDGSANKEVGAGQKQWKQDEVEAMARVFAEILDENNKLGRSDLERRVRSGTNVREFRGRCAGAGDEKVPEADKDVAFRLIEEHTKHSSLCDMVGPLMEQTAEIFQRVVDKGKRDGMSMDKEAEIEVLRSIIKESLVRHCLKCINSDNSGSYASGSHDAGLLATPQGYYAGDLESLNGETIRNLMERGYSYQDEFMTEGEARSIYAEMEYLDFDGKYTEVQQQKMTGYRTDRIGWFTLEGLDREKQPGLCALFKKMISIPFELNKKCSLYCQAGGNFQLSVYPKDAYYKRHIDGGYDEINNGRKITAIFYPNMDWEEGHGGHLKMYGRRKNPFQLAKLNIDAAKADEEEYVEEEQIGPKGGRLVLFRSRDMPHEVMKACKKRYAVSLWVNGPPGPGDQPDDHHTPT